MQFDYSHDYGSDYSKVIFKNSLKKDVWGSLTLVFEKLGGVELWENPIVWEFPHFITTDILLLVTNNTCFECGGLMKDEVVEVKIPTTFRGDIAYYTQEVNVRQCSVCGHSHT